MKSFRLVLGVVSGALVAAGMVSGCGGDDTVVSSKDASTDATTGLDGSQNNIDGSMVTDGGGGGSDGGVDSGVDGTAPFITPEQFIDQVAQTLCTRANSCCQGIDAGAIVNQKCLDVVRSIGWQGSSGDIARLIADQDAGPDSGQSLATVTFDLNGIQECLNAVKLIPCSVGSTLDIQAIQACYIDSVHGKQTTGKTCKYAAECTQPAYCAYTTDGGATGTCQPLVGSGGNCANVTGTGYVQAGNGSQACSRRATGTGQATPLFCDNINPDFSIKSADQWTCQPAKGLGSACLFNPSCKSEICNSDTNLCDDPLALANPAVCASFQ